MKMVPLKAAGKLQTEKFMLGTVTPGAEMNQGVVARGSCFLPASPVKTCLFLDV